MADNGRLAVRDVVGSVEGSVLTEITAHVAQIRGRGATDLHFTFVKIGNRFLGNLQNRRIKNSQIIGNRLVLHVADCGRGMGVGGGNGNEFRLDAQTLFHLSVNALYVFITNAQNIDAEKQSRIFPVGNCGAGGGNITGYARGTAEFRIAVAAHTNGARGIDHRAGITCAKSRGIPFFFGGFRFLFSGCILLLGSIFRCQ